MRHFFHSGLRVKKSMAFAPAEKSPRPKCESGLDADFGGHFSYMLVSEDLDREPRNWMLLSISRGSTGDFSKLSRDIFFPRFETGESREAKARVGKIDPFSKDGRPTGVFEFAYKAREKSLLIPILATKNMTEGKEGLRRVSSEKKPG